MRDSEVKPIEQADGSGGKWHAFLKRMKRRYERRKAKRNPECLASYGKYRGYEL
jgi:hypothetical protein